MMSDVELDPMAILATLGIADATAAEPVSGGWDTSIWRVERAGAAYALRVFRAGEGGTCRREVQVMQAAAAAGILVPTVHAEGSWRDRPALLLSWCAGGTVRAQMTPAPAQVWRLGIAFGQMQARIHAVPAPEVLLAEQERSWIGWAGPDEEPLQERLRAVAGSADRLLHLDYHPLNVMADGGVITGVLDWTNARAGDPRADLARTFTILRVTPLPPGTPALRALVARRALELGWRRGYRQAAESGDAAGRISMDEERALFYAWAGAVMARDLAPKIGRPGIWLQPRHLERIRRWANRWKRRAGIRG